ncbi:MAG: hypothetical protein R3E39_27615 [Anaerolineae bacterium]
MFNPNSVALTNVTASDTIPGELVIVRATTSAGTVSVSGNTISFTQAVMACGKFYSTTVITRVRDDIPVPFVIINSATTYATISSRIIKFGADY